MPPTKQFKNRQGEMPWYVVALLLAIIVLLVSLGTVWKIMQHSAKPGEQLDTSCKNVAEGKCVQNPPGCSPGQSEIVGLCGKGTVCCRDPSS